MSEVPVLPPEQQPESPTSSRRPSVDHDAFPDKPVRRPFQTLYEQQGRKPIGVSSAPTSRRGSIVQIPVPSRRPSIASIASSGAVFNESDFQPETPPATKSPVPDPAPLSQTSTTRPTPNLSDQYLRGTNGTRLLIDWMTKPSKSSLRASTLPRV